MISSNRKEIPENDEKFDQYCIEFALGLKDGDGYLTYNQEQIDLQERYANSIDPENFHGYPDSLRHRSLESTAFRISLRFDLFFSNIRNSMKKIAKTIDYYYNGPIYFFKHLQPSFQSLDDTLVRK